MTQILALEFLCSWCCQSFSLNKSHLTLLKSIRCVVKCRLSLKQLFIFELAVSPDLANSCVPKPVEDFAGSWGLRAARSVSINVV